jgi:arabinan endo-1,5-alpha-L-arabinosidase
MLTGNKLIRATRHQRQLWLGIVLSSATILSGCGGGGGGTTSCGSCTTTTTDMGTLTAMGDTDTYTFKNAASSMVVGVSGQLQTAGTNVVQESSSTTTNDIYWHFMPMGNSQYNVENMLTHQVLGILNASTSTGAQALQYSDNGTADHLWAFYLLTDGNYLIKNLNSGYYLQNDGSGTTSSATIDQGARSLNVTGCTCQEWVITSSGTASYTAPLAVSGTGIYVHDPYMLQDPTTHYYWLYGTHQTLAFSTDGTTFTYVTKTAEPAGSSASCTAAQGTYWLTTAGEDYCPIIGPDFASWTGLQTPLAYNNKQNTDVWAPDVLYDSGTSTYYQYYAIPYDPSTGAEAVIGLATSTTPYGPWTDKGYVVSSWTNATTTAPTNSAWNFVNTTTWNAIDPAPFVDASGNWWLVFGSWSDGTHLLELQSPSTAVSNATIGFPVSSGSNAYPVATSAAVATWYKIGARTNGEEGPFIYYWNGYYYYFAPINTCCNGTSSNYREIVGRSQSVTGPYYDRGGVSLESGGGTILISSHGNIYGPGGASVFTDKGSDGSKLLPTIVYHYYDGNNNGTPTLGINRLNFTSDGWPYI